MTRTWWIRIMDAHLSPTGIVSPVVRFILLGWHRRLMCEIFLRNKDRL